MWTLALKCCHIDFRVSVEKVGRRLDDARKFVFALPLE